MPALPTEGETLISAVSDDREYAFDLQHAPELRDPDVSIVSGVITGGTGLTITTPAVLAEAFDSIPAGKGMTARISGGVAGTTYRFALVATLSNSRKVVVPARLSKVADYGT